MDPGRLQIPDQNEPHEDRDSKRHHRRRSSAREFMSEALGTLTRRSSKSRPSTPATPAIERRPVVWTEITEETVNSDDHFKALPGAFRSVLRGE